MEGEKKRRGPIAVRFDQVSFAYGPVHVLEDVSFHIHQGECAALVGPNGAGKTTILKLLLGLEKPDGGTISLFDRPLEDATTPIGYVPQNAGYDQAFPISVLEVVRMGRVHPLSRRWNSQDNDAVMAALGECDVADLSGRSYSALSGGQRRRVLVARALASRPQLLVLDEPTANMDTESEMRLFRTLGNLKGKTTIMIVTHDSSFVSSLTDVVLCVGERNGEGRPGEVVRHRTTPTNEAPTGRYGGDALLIHHEEIVPDDWACEERTQK
jgi:zinc transport system ATP-binding protein